MALRSDYQGQTCSVARALEVVGERWTLLIVRDAFHGVRRFGDFANHLGIPRAVLASRLRALVSEDVMERVPGSAGHQEYRLSEKGRELWPVLRELMSWGDRYYAPSGALRVLRHVGDGGIIDETGRCRRCAKTIAAADTLIAPGPGLSKRRGGKDPISASIAEPHRLLEPLRP